MKINVEFNKNEYDLILHSLIAYRVNIYERYKDMIKDCDIKYKQFQSSMIQYYEKQFSRSTDLIKKLEMCLYEDKS